MRLWHPVKTQSANRRNAIKDQLVAIKARAKVDGLASIAYHETKTNPETSESTGIDSREENSKMTQADVKAFNKDKQRGMEDAAKEVKAREEMANKEWDLRERGLRDSDRDFRNKDVRDRDLREEWARGTEGGRGQRRGRDSESERQGAKQRKKSGRGH